MNNDKTPIPKQYILIDGSYFIFYRVFALQLWWKHAKPEYVLSQPFLNKEFVEKFKSTFVTKIRELKTKLKCKDAMIIVGKDCPRTQIWRMKLFPQYKDGRSQEKNMEANISDFFKLVYDEDLFTKSGADYILSNEHLEADDCSVPEAHRENDFPMDYRPNRFGGFYPSGQLA